MTIQDDYEPQCPICEHREFKWGYLQAQGLQFHSDDASWAKKNFTFGTRVRAAVCQECGYLLIFARDEENNPGA